MATHQLKVIPPYFDEVASGRKTFEVRKNDRAYQRGDILELREWHPDQTSTYNPCPYCGHWRSEVGHYAQDQPPIAREVTFVYSGDPRFSGLELGHVVLGLGVAELRGPMGGTA